ncbi:porin [Psychrobium sp. 1_MG-2023]|uniref:porin n=1 Tax=Psychrobium sp. 1_MG-2023 TaxID=3062624 RepID=UPI000C347D75|nr:porin [Psychrobium sp. 1_MG-2023]MDP2560116.1 porin [Psychrobium sp. 1_MG-2023]PKF56930.1 porin [Alteromonadales bacterium alter-6D02]
MRIYHYLICIISASLVVSPASASETDSLKQQLETLKKQLKNLENNLEKTQPTTGTSIVNNNKVQNNTFKAYATIRPTFGYIDENDQDIYDVRDALSHVGIKATSQFRQQWSAELHGEWGVDLSNNGDFGKARRAYVALNSPIGRFGIGKQRPVQYLFIAEYTDIFNHSNSPFAYDPESLFFVNNLLTYRLNTGNLTWMAAAQYSGNESSDLVNAGVSYDHKGLHSAITYLTQDTFSDGKKSGEDEVYAASLAYQFNNNFYLAFGYQDRTYQHQAENELKGSTLDVSSAYQLAEHYKLKVGYFEFDDGNKTQTTAEFNGFNTTLEWQPAPHLRFHLEYLKRDKTHQSDFSSWTIGFRYDYSKQWTF